MNRQPFHSLVLPAVAAGFALLLTACSGGEAPPPSTRASARIAAPTTLARLESTPQTLLATGTVEPSRRSMPGTKILGRVAKVAVREGERVAAGQLLARLEDRDLRAGAEQARAGVAMAEAQLENAAAQLHRMQELFARGSVTAKNLEDATAGQRVAQAGLEQAQAALQAAEVMLAQATVESPFAGWVSAKHAEVGDLVAPGSPMFTIEALDPVKIVVDVPESSVRTLAVGGKARVEIDAVGGRFDALVDRILPAGDQRARTFGVQLVLPNPEGVLKSGLFARAVFELGRTEVLLVPARALVERGQLQGLFVVDPAGVAQLRWVRLGARRHDESGAATGDRVEILSGLSPGERYVTEPPAELVDGMLVEGAAAAKPSAENASTENPSAAETRP